MPRACIASLVLLSGVSAWLSGCAQEPPARESLPRIGELQSRVTPPVAGPGTEGPLAVVRVVRMDFPLEADLSECWALAAAAEGLPAPQAGAWRDNGLRAGILPAGQAARFAAALPPPLRRELRHLVVSRRFEPLAFTPALDLPASVRLALPPFAAQPVTLEPGRFQFLLRYSGGQDAWPSVELVPHHHVPRQTLTPRPPLERALDGRVYHELLLHAPLLSGNLLVVGMPALVAPLPKPTTQPAATQPSASPPPARPTGFRHPPPPATRPGSPPQPQPPPHATPTLPLPDRLGTLLLCATRLGKPVQALIVISIQPIPITATAPAD